MVPACEPRQAGPTGKPRHVISANGTPHTTRSMQTGRAEWHAPIATVPRSFAGPSRCGIECGGAVALDAPMQHVEH